MPEIQQHIVLTKQECNKIASIVGDYLKYQIEIDYEPNGNFNILFTEITKILNEAYKLGQEVINDA